VHAAASVTGLSAPLPDALVTSTSSSHPASLKPEEFTIDSFGQPKCLTLIRTRAPRPVNATNRSSVTACRV